MDGRAWWGCRVGMGSSKVQPVHIALDMRRMGGSTLLLLPYLTLPYLNPPLTFIDVLARPMQCQSPNRLILHATPVRPCYSLFRSSRPPHANVDICYSILSFLSFPLLLSIGPSALPPCIKQLAQHTYSLEQQ
jgi:hypothetical protein